MNSSYVAGFFDGEGTVYKSGNKVRISIPQTNYGVLDEIRKFYNCGNIYEIKKREEHHKQSWTYVITNWEGCLDFLKSIRYDVIVKRKEVEDFIKQLEEKKRLIFENNQNRESDRLKVIELHNKGLSYRKIESIVGFSRQKVSRLLKEKK
jgi:uncharacterized protein YerC